MLRPVVNGTHPAAVLELARVSKCYRRGAEEVVALDGVDLAVRPGEFVSLVGPSGSGKSTLLHLAGGLDRPDAGRVVVAGVDVAGLSAGERAVLRRRQIGFVFQFFHLLPTLTVAENVELPLLLDGRRRARSTATDLLARVGLADRAGSLPGTLSGGEMQRAAIARALASRPPLILADEPTGNLDSRTGSEVLDVLQEQVADVGSALLMVTHDRAAAKRADRVVALEDGHLTEERPRRSSRSARSTAAAAAADGDGRAAAATATVGKRGQRAAR